MKIHIVSSVFMPEPIVSARTSADLAEQLARDGHRVWVIADFPNRPAGKLFDGYQRKPWMWDRSFKSFRVLRVFSLLSSESSMVSRFLENISFAISSSLAILFLEKADVVYANVWPIFAQGLLALACRLRGIPLVLSVQDVYPESLSTLSQMGNPDSWLFRLFRWIDRKTKQSCAAVVVISSKFGQIYIHDRRIDPGKVHIIPNWVDENSVQADSAENDVRRAHGIPEHAFLALYAGNIGAACGLEAVIEAFRNLGDAPSTYLLVAGSGSKLLVAQALAAQVGNPRICFHTPWLASETSSMLAAADLFVLPTYGDQSLCSVPSKLITYMLAARPVLCCAAEESDIARTIRKAACGWVVPASNPDVIARMLRALAKEPSQELQRFGQQGRNYALKHMTRASNLPRLIELIEGVAHTPRKASALGQEIHKDMVQ